MKYMFILLSLIVLLISCDNSTETIVEPEYFGEGFGENFEISASYGIDLGDDFISSIDSASQLFSVNSPDINHYGTSNIWKYKYYSSDHRKVYTITFESGSDWLSIGVDTTANDHVGNSIITKDWIDSDNALEIAEENGGIQFRNENADYIISASLSEALVPNSYPSWYIYYSSATENLYIKVNATNGEIISNY